MVANAMQDAQGQDDLSSECYNLIREKSQLVWMCERCETDLELQSSFALIELVVS